MGTRSFRPVLPHRNAPPGSASRSSVRKSFRIRTYKIHALSRLESALTEKSGSGQLLLTTYADPYAAENEPRSCHSMCVEQKDEVALGISMLR